MPEFNSAIDFVGDTDQFVVNLIAGQHYHIELEGSATGAGTLVDPVAELFLGGASVAFDDDGGRGLNSRIVFTPIVSGNYTVDVSEFLNNATGSYRLRVFEDDFRNTVEGTGLAGSVATAGSASGNLNYSGDADVFGTTLIAGLTYTIEQRGSATGNGTLADPFLYLLNGADTVLASNDDAGVGLNSLISYTAGFTGTHYLQARDFLDNSTGTYGVFVSEGVADNFNNIINCTAVADAVNGAGGNDTMNGFGGNDRLNGSTGNDVCRGGSGRDTMIGGLGDDRFDIDFTFESVGVNRDLIQGFEFSTAINPNDKIDLSTIDANAAFAGNQAFSSVAGVGLGQLSFVNLANGSTLIRGNTSAAAGFELEVEVADGATVAAFWSPSLDFVL